MIFAVTVYYKPEEKITNWQTFETHNPEPIKDPVFMTLKWVDINGCPFEYTLDNYIRHSTKNRSIDSVTVQYREDDQVGLMAHSRLYTKDDKGKLNYVFGYQTNKNVMILHHEVVDNEFGSAEPLYTIAVIEPDETPNQTKNKVERFLVFQNCLEDQKYDAQGKPVK